MSHKSTNLCEYWRFLYWCRENSAEEIIGNPYHFSYKIKLKDYPIYFIVEVHNTTNRQLLCVRCENYTK
jgi:hypothetical protein